MSTSHHLVRHRFLSRRRNGASTTREKWFKAKHPIMPLTSPTFKRFVNISKSKQLGVGWKRWMIQLQPSAFRAS